MKAILGLEVDGETLGVELGFEALSSIVYNIPDMEENTPIFAALARHPNPSIRSNIADKQNLDDELVVITSSTEAKAGPLIAGEIPLASNPQFPASQNTFIKDLISYSETQGQKAMLSAMSINT